MVMKTKYTFEKRQKEIAKLQKKKEKLAKRHEAKEPVNTNGDQENEVADI